MAGLTAARELTKKGAAVTVIEARDRVGGRVLTAARAVSPRQHAEVGADLIDESQTEICTLIAEVGLRTARILPGGFTSVRQDGRAPAAHRQASGGWHDLAKRLRPEVRAFCLGEQRWDGGVAEALARESVAQWLDRIRAPQALRDIAVGMRGFFLADPDELSLLALVDQFAEDGTPGSEKMFRIVGGNDRLPAALAKALGSRIQLQTILRRVDADARRRDGGASNRTAALHECALRLSRVRDAGDDVARCRCSSPRMPELQRQAIATVKYGAATKTALQFDRAPWRKRGKPRAFGTPFAIGAVWDGNEEQRGDTPKRRIAEGGHSHAARRWRRKRRHARDAGRGRPVAHRARALVARPEED